MHPALRRPLYYSAVILLAFFPLFLRLGHLTLRDWDESHNTVNALEMYLGKPGYKTYIVRYFEGQPDIYENRDPSALNPGDHILATNDDFQRDIRDYYFSRPLIVTKGACLVEITGFKNLPAGFER